MTKREFLQIAVAYLGGLLTFRLWQEFMPAPNPRPSLDIRIQGLSIMQKLANAVTVNFVNGSLVGMGTHNAWLVVPDKLVDPSSTAASFLHPYDSTLRVFNLERTTGPTAVTVPGAGGNAVDMDTSAVVVNNLPANDQWLSVNYVAQLNTLTGATAITADNSKFVARVQLEHGHLHGVQPAGAYGARTLWAFTGAAQAIQPQALTDTVVCHVDSIGSGPTFLIGSDTVVLNLIAGQPAQVTLSNLPPSTATGQCAGPHPCLDHLNAIYELVNAQHKPTAVGNVQGGVQVPDIEPSYCPPAMI